ncbi:MAG: hypothetical protein JOY59_02335 [Candidatus Eremiobacteraeota bacterium]|nr:hypothetical protein [Candidatus Eremiobacteraeota bacterium]
MIVTVLLNGVPLPASRPAVIQAGTVMVPVDPFIRRIAREVTVDPSTGTLLVRRDDRNVRVHVGAAASEDLDAVYVPLAGVVRGLGGSLSFDTVRKVAAVEMPGPGLVVTPTPYDSSSAPSIAPIQRSSPTPQPTPTPRPTLSGIPQPRRTPVPEVPSNP